MNKNSVLITVFSVLFICTTVIPSISAFNKSTIMNGVTKDISIINREDNFKEIITFIEGSFYNHKINKRGIIRDIEIFSGLEGKNIFISGWREIENGSCKEYFYEKNIQYIHAPRFFGFIHKSVRDPTNFGVIGFAFGDIDWQQISNI